MRIVFFLLFSALALCGVRAEDITYYALVDSADVYINNNDFAGAERVIIRALRLEPSNYNNSLLLSNLATIQRMQGRNDEALKNYTFAIYMTPNAVTLLKNRASLYLEMDSVDMAKSDFKKVASLDSKDIESRYYLVMIALDRNEVRDAQDVIEELKTLDRDGAETTECLARMHQAMRHYQEAATLYTRLMRKDKRLSLLVHRAECYLGLDDLPKASIDIEDAISQDSTDPYLYILKARLKKKQFLNDDVAACISLAVRYGLNKTDAELLLRAE